MAVAVAPVAVAPVAGRGPHVAQPFSPGKSSAQNSLGLRAGSASRPPLRRDSSSPRRSLRRIFPEIVFVVAGHESERKRLVELVEPRPAELTLRSRVVAAVAVAVSLVLTGTPR